MAFCCHCQVGGEKDCTAQPGSDRVQHPVTFEQMQRLGQRHTGIQTPPSAGVPHPVDVKAVRAHAVDAGEGCVELLACIVCHTRAVTLHKAVAAGSPGTMDVDDVVELG